MHLFVGLPTAIKHQEEEEEEEEEEREASFLASSMLALDFAVFPVLKRYPSR